MSQPVTVRLPAPSWEELRQIARRERRSVSEVGARFITEGLRINLFPYVEFRSFNGERHACIKGGPQIWQLIMVAKDLDMDVDNVANHIDLKPEQVRAGLKYYRDYAEEIDVALQENNLGFERLKAMLPNIEIAELSINSNSQASN